MSEIKLSFKDSILFDRLRLQRSWILINIYISDKEHMNVWVLNILIYKCLIQKLQHINTSGSSLNTWMPQARDLQMANLWKGGTVYLFKWPSSGTYSYKIIFIPPFYIIVLGILRSTIMAFCYRDVLDMFSLCRHSLNLLFSKVLSFRAEVLNFLSSSSCTVHLRLVYRLWSSLNVFPFGFG